MSTKRRILKGLSISHGIALGRTRVITVDQLNISDRKISSKEVSYECEALERAISSAVTYLQKLRKNAQSKMGVPLAKIFAAQVLIAEDQDFIEKVKRRIADERTTAAWAYQVSVQESITPLKESLDIHLQQTAQDIEGVARKVLSFLVGAKLTSDIEFPPNAILVGENFTPGEILSARAKKASGFLVGEGGKNSHTALIARSLMLPVIVLERGWKSIPNKTELILDGQTGEVILNPSKNEIAEYEKKRKRLGVDLASSLRKIGRMPVHSADGKPVTLAANLELPGPLDDLLAQMQLPVGLYRTEFLYLQRNCFPSEKEQTQYYQDIANTFPDTYVVLRTFDLGSDKVATDDLYPHEDNPALGWRGIRAMLDSESIFLAQLRAILRASGKKNLRILLPMISEPVEIERTKLLLKRASSEIKRAGIAIDEKIKVGIMVEVPSAAITLEHMLPLVDFVAIGSNDLTQYTMSADRNNSRVSSLYDPMQPAVLSLIKLVTEQCLKMGKPVCVCGEAAGDPLAIPLFVGMGIREFSMNPAKLFDVYRLIRQIDTNQARSLVASCMHSTSAAAVNKKLKKFKTSLSKKKLFRKE